MNDFDKQILRLLADNGRLSWTEIAEHVNLSPSAVQRHVQQMQASGLIKHFTIALDTKKLGHEVRSFVEVKMQRSDVALAKQFREIIRELPQVQSCYKLSGSVDFILDVVAPNLEAYGQFLEREILSIPGVLDASSSIILEEVKAYEVMVESARHD
ncbi:Lrp/AsnC family transcriptional regulator [Leucothrix pacifica]|uniref:AsnC family transcriptional regulator n=1 Tax=Leucothrix pacifica TaxID=1247513 RepID=A0A317C850_9GAMM|nr:Lrp/AsnC family transcriptional regulator [Leucothrix pacifica]PWQ92302.1 AsnC family transcriptional regulator [Leucothrix pacifica]